MTRTTDRVIPEAVDECRGLLGISRNVRIRRVLTLNGDASGQYQGQDPFTGDHLIDILVTLNPRVAHRVLVHELVHARQAECEGGHIRFFAEYRRQLTEAGIGRGDPDFHHRYRTIPFEHEAYRVAALCHEYPVMVRPDERLHPRVARIHRETLALIEQGATT